MKMSNLPFSVTMTLFYIAVFILVLLVLCFLISTLFASSFSPPPELRNKRILLLIGHPDDEAMFFAPALIALVSPANGNQVRIICLSTGNAVGQGEIRKGELMNSARRLGIPRDEDVDIIEDPRFQDGGQNDWKKEDIADFLAHTCTTQPTSNPSTSHATSFSTSQQHPEARPQHQLPNARASPLTPGPEVIITFDPHGISTHPNHCACYHGAVHFLQQQPRYTSTSTLPALYTLPTHSLFRKYISILDAPLTFLTIYISSLLKPLPQKRRTTPTETPAEPEVADRVMFVSGFREYTRAFGAMVFAHRTQMLWFRWGWIVAGRYMVVNDLKREWIAS
jgi:N-acetylglucosaminylphosphatidylinositol deacetylase